MIKAKYATRDKNPPLTIQRFTVVILCGPSECGKSCFAKELKSQLNKQNLTCSIISSDECRRELLCSPQEHKHSSKMMTISGPAFDLAYNKLKNHTTYPVNTDIVIFDSTALDKYSREKIASIATENNYSHITVSFDYDDEQEYYKHTEANWLVDKHLSRFRKDKPTGYKLRNRTFPNIDFQPGCRYKTLNKESTVIISDVHGHYDELIDILKKTGFWTKDDQVNSDRDYVLVGDYIDKHDQTEEVVEFLFPHVVAGNITVVRGNHENWVVKKKSGEISNDSGIEHFDSIHLGELFHARLREIWLRSFDFVKNDHIIVTHSPCDISDLEKPKRLREMRNLRHSQISREELFKKLDEFASRRTKLLPKHIFGHIEFDEIYNNRGMIGIDGPKLTAAITEKEKINFVQVGKND